MEFSIKNQIHVLANLDFEKMFEQSTGLCNAITTKLQALYRINAHPNEVKDYIPLFNYQNAQKFSAVIQSHLSPFNQKKYDIDYNYWWELNEMGLGYRKEFIQWIINELEKSI